MNSLSYPHVQIVLVSLTIHKNFLMVTLTERHLKLCVQWPKRCNNTKDEDICHKEKYVNQDNSPLQKFRQKEMFLIFCIFLLTFAISTSSNIFLSNFLISKYKFSQVLLKSFFVSHYLFFFICSKFFIPSLNNFYNILFTFEDYIFLTTNGNLYSV